MRWVKELENLERIGPYKQTDTKKKKETQPPKETKETIYQEIEKIWNEYQSILYTKNTKKNR